MLESEQNRTEHISKLCCFPVLTSSIKAVDQEVQRSPTKRKTAAFMMQEFQMKKAHSTTKMFSKIVNVKVLQKHIRKLQNFFLFFQKGS